MFEIKKKPATFPRRVFLLWSAWLLEFDVQNPNSYHYHSQDEGDDGTHGTNLDSVHCFGFPQTVSCLVQLVKYLYIKYKRKIIKRLFLFTYNPLVFFFNKIFYYISRQVHKRHFFWKYTATYCGVPNFIII